MLENLTQLYTLNIRGCMPVLKEALFSCFLFGGDSLGEHRSDGFKTRKNVKSTKILQSI